MMSEPVTLRLDSQTRKRLDKLAKTTERSRAALAAEAIRQFVDLNEWQIAAITEGIKQADSGHFIDHAALKAKWEKKLAAAMDKTR
jgi:RHH-type rel operon transcriptional repressor/antitoxin RelB